MVTKLWVVSVILFASLVLLTAGACNVSGQPCGLLNLSACAPPSSQPCGNGGGDMGMGGDIGAGAGDVSGGAGGSDSSDPGDPDPQGLGCNGAGGNQQTSIVLLEGADPTQASIVELEAEYTAYVIEGMIAQNPSAATADATALEALAAQYAPAASAQAQQWAQGLDPSTIPLFSPDPDTQDKCVQGSGCDYVVKCPGIGICSLAGCGQGKCPTCPNIFNFSSVIVTGWCSHVCVGSDGTGAVVGYAAVIHFRGGLSWRYCQAVANRN